MSATESFLILEVNEEADTKGERMKSDKARKG